MKKRPGSWVFAWKQLRAIKRLKERGVAIVWTAHNRIPHESEFPMLDHLLSSKVASIADRIIVHSNAAREEITEACGIKDQRKIELIYHGNYRGVYGDLPEKGDSRVKLGLGNEEFVFLFLGAVRPHKGVSDLIDAYRLANLDCRLIIAGNIQDKEFESELRDLEKELPGLVLMSGFIPDEDLGGYFAASDVVVLPYQRSLTSGALVLAMSFERACIVPDFDTFTEFIDERGGFSYPAGSTFELAEAMRKAMEARGRMEEFGRCNGKIASRWDWKEVARRTSAVYDEAFGMKAEGYCVDSTRL
ncbi:glycosyltransferase family 4 protein [Haloferula sp.]|uniref:glycosyltransferase family 4 protein n=1 Tax=Haloferula sp. TaxID=2497595 RepID=UPI003C72C7EE